MISWWAIGEGSEKVRREVKQFISQGSRKKLFYESFMNFMNF